MRGNSFGKLFSLTSFGESHGPAIGVVVDGVPSCLDFSLEDLTALLRKRAPGKLKGTSARNENDIPEILSGIFENKTLGTPIAVIVRNMNQNSSDYDQLKTEMRPGHADQTTLLKYGIRDHRGGGRSSGRETIARVIAGYFAGLVLKNVNVTARIFKVGPFSEHFNQNDFENYLEELKKKGESVGGVVALEIENCPVGLGEPSFDKLKADLGKALLSIGGCVAFSYGMGFGFQDVMGSEVAADRIAFGGIEGGISNGEKMTLQVVFKPTSTIGEKAISGRHDPCILPRVLPVVESMVKIVLCDHYLRQKAYEI